MQGRARKWRKQRTGGHDDMSGCGRWLEMWAGTRSVRAALERVAWEPPGCCWWAEGCLAAAGARRVLDVLRTAALGCLTGWLPGLGLAGLVECCCGDS